MAPPSSAKYGALGIQDEDNLEGPPPKGAGAKMLISHTFTKLGSKAWQFAMPIMLLEFAPGSLVAPALWGIITMGANLALGPTVGSWADKVSSRLISVTIGCAVQASTALAAVCILSANSAANDKDGNGTVDTNDASALTAFEFLSSFHPLFLLMAVVGCIEGLASNFAGTAVKRDWVPTVFERYASDEVLSSMNTQMSRIDLIAEMLGPVVAGTVMAVAPTKLVGFVLIGVGNALSFAPEYLLLRQVYFACARLRQPLGGKVIATAATPTTDDAEVSKPSVLEAWSVWFGHSGGVPVVTVSYALLYFTALSPHGVVLLAFLAGQGISPAMLSLFTASGAAAGVVGVTVFEYAIKCAGIRTASFIYVAMEAAAVVIAACSFSSAVAAADAQGGSMGTASMATLFVFMLAVVVSRVGLYGFDVGVLELQQRQVDEKDRNAVGAVENSLTSAGTLLIMAYSMDTTTPETFVHIVWASAVAVCVAALLFGAYLKLWHEHVHSHPAGFEDSHAHTTQQRRMLVESSESKHVHMHYAGPSLSVLFPFARIVGEAAHEHDHGHDHSHDHDHGHSHGHDHRRLSTAV